MNDRDSFDKLYKKSIEYLDSVSGLELMHNVASLASDIDRVVDRHRLPPAVIMGVLMAKIQEVFKAPETLSNEKAIMGLSDTIKKYLDENFMKKEKLQENR